MPDLIYDVAASVDGYIATRDGEVHWLTSYQMSTMPSMLGQGLPLFAEARSPQPLQLIDSVSYPNGVVRRRYVTQVASKPNPSAIR